MSKMMIKISIIVLFTIFIPSVFAETILECNGTLRTDITNGVGVEEGKPIKKNILYILNEDGIQFENLKIQFENITPTHYYWFWNPNFKSPSLKMTLDIVSGELNRVTGETYFRKTYIDDKNVPKYREEVFKGECSETEARF